MPQHERDILEKAHSIISSLPTELYTSNNPVPKLIIDQLGRFSENTFKELYEYLRNNNGFASDPKYLGLLHRIYGLLELDNPDAQRFREKYVWMPMDYLNIEQLLSGLKMNDIIAITDYKDRYYEIINTENGLTVLTAINSDSNDIFLGKIKVKDQRVNVIQGNKQMNQSLLTDKISLFPQNSKVYINDAKEFVNLGPSYGNILMPVNRIVLFFLHPNIHDGIAILPSRVEIIPNDQHEMHRLQAAQWRIKDTIQKIRTLSIPLDTRLSKYVLDRIEVFTTDEINFILCNDIVKLDYDISPTRQSQLIRSRFSSGVWRRISPEKTTDTVAEIVPMWEAAQIVENFYRSVQNALRTHRS